MTTSGAPMPSSTYTVPATGGAARFGPVLGGLLVVGGLALVSFESHIHSFVIY